MKSSGVSFIPPLKPLVRGVRIANVMTTSSGFFWVLEIVSNGKDVEGGEEGSHCGQSALAWGEVAKDRAQSFRSHDIGREKGANARAIENWNRCYRKHSVEKAMTK